MRFHLCSVSSLAIATAATLALPMSGASAADFVLRNGKKVAASLEMPVEAPEPSAPRAANTGNFVEQLNVDTNQYVTNNGDTITTVYSSGHFTNNGRVNQLQMNGGTVVNNDGEVSIFSGVLNAGSMVNNGSLYSAEVKSGASLVSNENASSRYINNSGTLTNHGSVGNVSQENGTFTNSDKGDVYRFRQSGGATTNGGHITSASVDGGTFNNLGTGVIGSAGIGGRTFNNGTFTETAATLDNSGKIEMATVEKLGTLNNNAGGVVDTLTNAGTVLNHGQIGTVTQTGGNLINHGIILGEMKVDAGLLTNFKSINTVNTAAGTTTLNEYDGQIKSLTNNGITTNNGAIQNVTQEAGSFTNGADGSVGSLWQNDGASANEGAVVNAFVKSGTLTNNTSGSIINVIVKNGMLLNGGKIENANIDAGGSMTNNQDAVIKNVTTKGTVTNGGLMADVEIEAGDLTNSADAKIGTLSQTAGTTSNNGEILITTVRAGTLTNNEKGTLSKVTLKGGVIANNGTINDAIIAKDGTLTNNDSGTVDTLTNAGIVKNAGQITNLLQNAGTFTNNGTILGDAEIKQGKLTNNKSINGLTIATGADIVNNKDGVIKSITNAGAVKNDGLAEYVSQSAGTLVNGPKGQITGLTQTGGASTNNGIIDRATLDGGTIVNNKTGNINQVLLQSGSLQNNGKLETLSIEAGGRFVNNISGSVDDLTSLGNASSDGKIGSLDMHGGRFKNTGTVKKTVQVFGGKFTSTGIIGGKLTNFGISALSGTINGGVGNGEGGLIGLGSQLNGKGQFINDGTVKSANESNITGFNTFANKGTLAFKDDLTISGDLISSGKIGMGGDLTKFNALEVGGNLTLTSKSTTSINLDVDGSHDTLAAGKNLTLGGTLKVAASGDDYALKSTYETFTSAAGKVVGDFANVVISGTKGLFGIVENTQDGLVLAIRNREALNTKLDALELGKDSQVVTSLEYEGKEGAELFDTLTTLKAKDAPGLISQITGTATSAIVHVGNNAAKGFGNLMQKVATASGMARSNDGVLAYERAMAAEQAGKFQPVLRDGQGAVGFWARGFGENDTTSNKGDAALGGFAAGVEVATSQSLTVGASAGYSIGRFGHKTGAGKGVKGDVNSMHGGLYAAFGATAPEATGFGLTASGSYSKHDTNAERTMKIGGMKTIANANFGGTTIAGEVMVRNGFTVGKTVPFTIAPIAGLKFSIDNDETYTETGAGALNLTVGRATRRSVMGVVGVQLASRFETESVVFTPHVSGVYQHEFLDTSSTTRRTLGSSATPFTVKQNGGARSSVALEAGLGLRFAGGLAVDVSGYGVFSGDEKRYGATATLKAGF